VFDIFLHAWLNASALGVNKKDLRRKIDDVIKHTVGLFKDTDGVTLLSFVARLLPRLDLEVS
jgi:hypothetical protein